MGIKPGLLVEENEQIGYVDLRERERERT